MWFIDTSVLTELLEVPGKCQQAEQIRRDFDERWHRGHKFVLPISTIIETGNHIAQCHAAGRRQAAEKLNKAILAARGSEPPWIIRDITWDDRILQAFLDGDSTGSTLTDLLGSGRMGTGDVSILVERDEFRTNMAYTDVRVWSLEAELSSLEQ